MPEGRVELPRSLGTLASETKTAAIYVTRARNSIEVSEVGLEPINPEGTGF